MRKKLTIVFVVIVSLWVVGAQAGSLVIDHTPIGCMELDSFPVIEAGFAPLADTDSGRVYFRAKGTENWYFVEFKGPDEPWKAVLPQPASSLEGIDYYILGTDLNGIDSETQEYHSIVSTRTACDKDGLSSARSAESDDIALVIGIQRYGQEALPPGFLSDGISQIMMPNGRLESFQRASSVGGTWAKKGESTRVEASDSFGGLAITGMVVGGLAVGYGAYELLNEDSNQVINCGSQYTGKGSKSVTVKLGQSMGGFLFEWDMGPQADQMRLLHIGNVTHDTGCTQGIGNALVQFGDRESSKITVTVLADCEGEGGGNAEWSFTLHCPE